KGTRGYSNGVGLACIFFLIVFQDTPNNAMQAIEGLKKEEEKKEEMQSGGV
ncbi:hypothetical protein ACJX0J_025364, partial [Zea mays]